MRHPIDRMPLNRALINHNDLQILIYTNMASFETLLRSISTSVMRTIKALQTVYKCGFYHVINRVQVD